MTLQTKKLSYEIISLVTDFSGFSWVDFMYSVSLSLELVLVPNVFSSLEYDDRHKIGCFKIVLL